jgi:hypothetical protein
MRVWRLIIVCVCAPVSCAILASTHLLQVGVIRHDSAELDSLPVANYEPKGSFL